jgi:hypothetical protein
VQPDDVLVREEGEESRLDGEVGDAALELLVPSAAGGIDPVLADAGSVVLLCVAVLLLVAA